MSCLHPHSSLRQCCCSADEYKGHIHLEYAHRGEVSKMKKSLSSKLANFQHPQTQDSPLVGRRVLVAVNACCVIWCVVLCFSTEQSCPPHPPPPKRSRWWNFCSVRVPTLTSPISSESCACVWGGLLASNGSERRGQLALRRVLRQYVGWCRCTMLPWSLLSGRMEGLLCIIRTDRLNICSSFVLYMMLIGCHALTCSLHA